MTVLLRSSSCSREQTWPELWFNTLFSSEARPNGRDPEWPTVALLVAQIDTARFPRGCKARGFAHFFAVVNLSRICTDCLEHAGNRLQLLETSGWQTSSYDSTLAPHPQGNTTSNIFSFPTNRVIQMFPDASPSRFFLPRGSRRRRPRATSTACRDGQREPTRRQSRGPRGQSGRRVGRITSFSAVSAPIFARKYAFYSIFKIYQII